RLRLRIHQGADPRGEFRSLAAIAWTGLLVLHKRQQTRKLRLGAPRRSRPASATRASASVCWCVMGASPDVSANAGRACSLLYLTISVEGRTRDASYGRPLASQPVVGLPF